LSVYVAESEVPALSFKNNDIVVALVFTNPVTETFVVSPVKPKDNIEGTALALAADDVKGKLPMLTFPVDPFSFQLTNI
jgi:hypothetical protein